MIIILGGAKLLGIEKRLTILSEVCKSTVEQMSILIVDDIKIEQSKESDSSFPFAHIIDFTHADSKINGNFMLAFRDVDEALKLSSAIARRLGIDGFSHVCDDSTDLLNEFLNVVVGRTISEWDSIGLTANFKTPVLKRNYQCEKENTKAYVIRMIVKDESKLIATNVLPIIKIVLRLNFVEIEFSKLQNKKILLVDDSKVMRSIIAKPLKERGAIIKEAVNGLDAIRVFRSYLPDITLMDINMPEINGFEAIARIREIHPNSKFMILSSSSKKDEIITARSLNVSGYLVKPPNIDELINRLTEVL